jgi:DNA primase
VFDFVMQREGLEFRDTLEQLARRAGIELQERTPDIVQQDQMRTRLLEINQSAAAFFHHVLVKSSRGEAARAYIQRRAINAETIESFQLGYAVDDWSALLSYLTDRKGFEPEEVEAAGLAIRREQGGWYDRFRDRLMFPIRNAKGEVIAFGGRSLGDAQPKYMNSPQTALFDKGKILYGFDLARETIRASEAAVIVEGYVDVLMAHQYGFRNVVAPLGTALTSDHVDLIKRLTRRVYLALDADTAGVRAALKGAQALQENPDGALVAVTGPQGVVGLQRGQSLEIRIIALPDGKDPDEFIQADPEGWRALVEAARPAMDFYLTALTADLDLNSARGKSDAVERLAPLLAQITNPVEHAHYIQQLARLIDVDESVIMRALPRDKQTPDRGRAARPVPNPRTTGKPTVAPTVPARVTAEEIQAEHLLCWFLRYASARDAVLEKLRRDLAALPLAQQILSEALIDLFDRPEHRAILQLWEAEGANLDPERWAEELDGALRETAQRVLTRQPPAPQAYRYVNDALECATILQQYQARRWLTRFSRQAEEAGDEVERLQAFEYVIQITEFLGMISAPRRSSTYADLHNLHTA